MNLHWLLRMSRWARHPPPMSRVLLVLAVVGICALIFAAERFGLLPDWMQADRIRPPVIR